MAELPQGLCLDLADTFAGHVELLADLLQRAGSTVLNAKAQLQDLFLTGGQRGEDVHQLLLLIGVTGRKERDEFVDEVLKSAGYTVIHLREIDTTDIEKQVQTIFSRFIEK